MRTVGGFGLDKPRDHAVGRCGQGVADQVRPGVFDTMRQTSDHQDNSVVAAAKDTLGLDAEPLLPCDGDEIRREARACNLPIAFDRNAGGAFAG